MKFSTERMEAGEGDLFRTKPLPNNRLKSPILRDKNGSIVLLVQNLSLRSFVRQEMLVLPNIIEIVGYNQKIKMNKPFKMNSSTSVAAVIQE